MNNNILQWRKEGVSWRDIGGRLGKSNAGCMKHYRNILLPALDVAYGWSAHKDGLILYHRLVMGTTWQEIGKLVNLDSTVCMARFRAVLEPVLAKSPGAETLEQSSTFRAVMKEWQWQPSELQQWYQQRVDVIGLLNVKLPEEMRWTQAMEHRLWAMRQQGCSWQQVATALEMSEKACLRRFKLRFLDKAELEPTSQDKILSVGRPCETIWTPVLDKQLFRLRQLGLTWREIGSRLQISHVACRRRYEATLWPAANQYWNEERSTQLAGYLHEGKDAGEIAEAMGGNVHPMAIDRQAKKVMKQEQRERKRREQETLRQQRRIRRRLEKTLGGEKLCPASLEQFYTEHDWDRLLQDDTSFASSSMSRDHQKASWQRRHGVWTIEQETILIQQVLQRGLDDNQWSMIASAVGGNHSAEECRIRWKNLDMPVKKTARMPASWSLECEQAFWRIWRDQQHHVDWDQLAKELGEHITANECEQYFECMTAPLRSKSVPKHLAQRVFDDRIGRLSEAMIRKGGVLFWTKQRSTQLQTLARVLYGPHWSKRRRILWRRVAKQMGNGVTQQQCHQHWAYLKPARLAEWTRDEVKLLERGVRIYGEDWTAICEEFLPHRTVGAVRRKWFMMSDHGAKLTVDEYMTLLTSIRASRSQHGGRIDWFYVSSQLPGWTIAPCRRVWESSYEYLLEQAIFSEEEDRWLVANMDPCAPQDWESVPHQLDGTKSPWLCRLRWCQLTLPC